MVALLSSIPVLVALVVAGCWVAAFRPTARHPRYRRAVHGSVVVCCGASVTHGRMSWDWVEDLERRLGRGFSVVNLGHNGWRAEDVRRDVGRAVAYEPDFALVMVGVNDVLRSTPLDAYRAEMRAIVRDLQVAGARVGLMTLTMVGDDASGEWARRQEAYDAVIREVAAETGASVVEVSGRQRAWLAAHGQAVRWSPASTLSAVVQRYLLRRSWDAISAAHGLLLTTDGVHQNGTGGEMISGAAAEWLGQGEAAMSASVPVTASSQRSRNG